MKKQICLILAAFLLTMSALTAYADTGDKADTAIRIEPGTGDEKYCWFVA